MTSSSKGSRDGGVARRVAVFAATVIVAYAAASVATTREGLARVVLSTTKTNDGRAPMWAKEGHAPLKAFFNDAMADAPTGLTRGARRQRAIGDDVHSFKVVEVASLGQARDHGGIDG